MVASGPRVRLVPVDPAADPEFAGRLMEYWGDLGVTPPRPWHARYLRRLAEEQGKTRFTFWGVGAEGPVGFTVLRLDTDWLDPARRLGYIAEFAILPAVRRRGWGRAMFAAAAGWLAERGCAEVELDVIPANPRGLAFWSALGFCPAYLHLRRGVAEDRHGRGAPW